METRHYPLSFRLSFVLLSIILFFYGIIVAKDFLYPIAFGVLIAYLLYPLVNFLEKKGWPRILSILVSEIFMLAVLITAIIFIYRQIGLFVDDFPSFKVKALSNIDAITHNIEMKFGLRDEQVVLILKDLVRNFFEVGSESFGAIFQNTAGAVVSIGLLPVYTFLFLYYRTKFAIFILKIVNPGFRFRSIKIMREISHVATNYMGGVLIVVSILCVINSLGLYIVDMKYALVLGILSALFNFIPYFGTLMGATIPVGFAFLIGDSPIIAIRVIILYAIIHFIENNVLTPNIVGGNLRINPFFIIISLILGALLWGIPGMLVVVPFMAIGKIICKHVPRLQPFSYLLGNSGTRRHAITIDKVKRLFQKH